MKGGEKMSELKITLNGFFPLLVIAGIMAYLVHMFFHVSLIMGTAIVSVLIIVGIVVLAILMTVWQKLRK